MKGAPAPVSSSRRSRQSFLEGEGSPIISPEGELPDRGYPYAAGREKVCPQCRHELTACQP